MRMYFVAAVGALAGLTGCPISESEPNYVDAAPAVDAGPSPIGGICQRDSDCMTGLVCSRTATCLPPAQVKAVTAQWTIGGQAATVTNCASITNLVLTFQDTIDAPVISFEKVACASGRFFLDKIERSVTKLTATVVQGPRSDVYTAIFNAEGSASINITP